LTLQVLLKILNPVFFATFGKIGIATAVWIHSGLNSYFSFARLPNNEIKSYILVIYTL
jgi:hypothetical protein